MRTLGCDIGGRSRVRWPGTLSRRNVEFFIARAWAPGRSPRRRLDELLAARADFSTPQVQAMVLAREASWHGNHDLAREVARRALPRLTQSEARFTAFVLLDSLGAAESFADTLVRSRPGAWEPRAFHGVLVALSGNGPRADEALAILADVRDPYEERHRLWMARITAIAGDKDEAVRLLREAYSAGVSFNDSFHADPFLEPLRDHPGFQEFVRPKG